MSSNPIKKNAYYVFDIEADGPAPATNNMKSFGLVIYDSQYNKLDEFYNTIVSLPDHHEEKKTREEFWDKHPELWKEVNENQVHGSIFVKGIEDLVNKYKDTYKINWVSKPAAYDWQWLNYYYNLFKSENAPYIGHKAICASTLLWMYTRTNNIMNSKDADAFEESLASKEYKLTHNALDDAHYEASIFFNICKLLQIPL